MMGKKENIILFTPDLSSCKVQIMSDLLGGVPASPWLSLNWRK